MSHIVTAVVLLLLLLLWFQAFVRVNGIQQLALAEHMLTRLCILTNINVQIGFEERTALYSISSRSMLQLFKIENTIM